MMNYYEKQIAEVLIKMLLEGDDCEGRTVMIGSRNYFIRPANRNVDLVMTWETNDDDIPDGYIMVGNWKENWVKTLELFAAAIQCDIG